MCLQIRPPCRPCQSLQGHYAPRIWSVCLLSVSELPELLEWGFSTLAGFAAPPGLHPERNIISISLGASNTVVCSTRIDQVS